MLRTVYRGKHVVVAFEMDRVGIARCAVGPELKAAVLDLAENKAKPYAVAISEPFRKTGDYIENFEVSEGHTVIAEMRRVAAILANTSAHAAAVEWGNAQTKGNGHRVLQRTLDHLNGLT